LLPQVQVLRAVWSQQFSAADEHGVVHYREAEDLPPGAELIVSPYDVEARNGCKDERRWVGYKVHLTETCDDDSPHLITHVETTPATATDEAALAPIHEALKQGVLLPTKHLVDAGYVVAARLVASKEQYLVRLVGPLTADSSWQAQAGQGYAAAYFVVDWDRQKVTCPAGQQSRHWTPKQTAYGAAAIQVAFAAATCRPCPARELCTKQTRHGRTLSLKPQELHLAMLAQRAEQDDAEFKGEYKRRAGVEATLAQGLRVGGLRQSRYIGLARTALQHLLIAVALNLSRLVAWWAEQPLAPTRRSAFARLASKLQIAPAYAAAGT
jgi:transposase